MSEVISCKEQLAQLQKESETHSKGIASGLHELELLRKKNAQLEKKMSDQNVRGIIVAGKYDEKLDYARKMVSGLEVFIYEVQFSLKEHVKN